ncbi:MAG: LemA family protein [Bacteroidales bacterium]|jgi:LemA protein|nr:LemA family protein [Bacteroidales bacterium]
MINSKNRNTLIIVGIIVILIVWAVSAYNGLVKKEVSVSDAWANVESVYQRRADLIPNLVKTVQGAADFEKGTLESVIEARSAATSVQIDAKDLTPENMAKFQQAQDNLSGALSRLMVVVERYPELKATENFRDLQAQLEGTENRINVERQKFNQTVKEYNTSVRKFPANLIAGMFSFEQKAFFKAEEGADKAPDVDFNFGK